MAMLKDTQKALVIGGGIAGLCAAVYAQRCGYQAEVLEMNDVAGGLATSWRRGGYTFETCLHWLLGSNPNNAMHSQWADVFDIGKLTFLYPEEFVRFETEHGETLSIPTNVDRLESELIRQAPQDAQEIRRFAADVRRLFNFKLPDPSLGFIGNLPTYVRDLPYLPLLRRLTRMTSSDYGRSFTHPLLRSFFGEGETGQMSAIALFFSLAWMSRREAGYPIGGSQAVIQLIAQKLTELGGNLRLGAKVDKILIKNDIAVGVELVDGEKIHADWVISAADGNFTRYHLLNGRYGSRTTEELYRKLETFPSYLQVSLGVARDLSQYPGFFTRILETPLEVDPATTLKQVSFRIFNFDPTFAPAGRTAVTCFLPTRNFEYWVHLNEHADADYQTEKKRVAEAVLSILEKKIPTLRGAIDVIDVATPATVIRFTGNWKGSMEGWLLTPETGFTQLPNTVPGLARFLMVGQWIMPGGGLPAGLMTARSAVRAMCRQDELPFYSHPKSLPPTPVAPTARPTSASSAAH
jgi:phytoene dehydrogenase-like protein